MSDDVPNQEHAMHDNGLGAILNALPAALSRRGLLPLLTGGLLATGPLALEDELLARKRRKRRKGKRKRNKQSNKPRTRVDATCAAPDEIVNAPSSGNLRLAQTFTAQRSGLLTRAELLLFGDGNVEPEFIVRLAAVDEAGTPTNNVLAEASASGTAVSVDSATVSFAFADPPPVVAGTAYALVLSRLGADFISWAFREDNTCNGRSFFSVGRDELFELIPDGQIDFTFATFVRSEQ
jgi:hypothetical protein